MDIGSHRSGNGSGVLTGMTEFRKHLCITMSALGWERRRFIRFGFYKALIKMAVTGFGCESGADVFHAQQDASRWLGASVTHAEKNLVAVQGLGVPGYLSLVPS